MYVSPVDCSALRIYQPFNPLLPLAFIASRNKNQAPGRSLLFRRFMISSGSTGSPRSTLLNRFLALTETASRYAALFFALPGESPSLTRMASTRRILAIELIVRFSSRARISSKERVSGSMRTPIFEECRGFGPFGMPQYLSYLLDVDDTI